MIWEVVVVFYWLESCGFAEETEVVDWDGVGKEGLYGYIEGEAVSLYTLLEVE